MCIRSKIIRYPGILAWIGLLLVVVGCSKSSSPTSPTMPTVTPLKIDISAGSGSMTTDAWGGPAVALLVGASEVFTATATAADGTTTPITGGVWDSDDLSVATVDMSTGRVTIVGGGLAVIGVQYQGSRGQLGVRGIPNFHGSFSGDYSFSGCVSSGDFSTANWCNNFPAHEVFPVQLTLSQNLDAVSGRAVFGSFSGDVSGVVVYRDLNFVVTVSQGSCTIDVLWKLKQETPGRITGSLVWFCRSAKMSGEANAYADIRSLNPM